MKRCLNCGIEIFGHTNKKFCTNKGKANCKDLYYRNGAKSVEPDEYLDEYMDDPFDNLQANRDE